MLVGRLSTTCLVIFVEGYCVKVVYSSFEGLRVVVCLVISMECVVLPDPG